MTNHLGNVLAVVADKKLPVKATVGNAINFWQADVVNATDYYPFGMPMPGRNGLAYQSSWVPGRGFVAGSSYPEYLQISSRPYAPTPGSYRAGREVELLPGFETATSDELIVEIVAGSGVLSNEYAGGEGSYESYGYYRYGFNGKEMDNEVKGTGNQQDYGMRIYDPRLGRFLSVDPLMKSYPWLSTYQFAANSPISGTDLDGGEYRYYMINLIQQNGKVVMVRPEAWRVEYAKKFVIETIMGPVEVKVPRTQETFVAHVGAYSYKFASYELMQKSVNVLKQSENLQASKECNCLPGGDLENTEEAEGQVGRFFQGLGNSAAAGVFLGDGAKNLKSIVDKFPNLTRLGRTTKESVYKKLHDYVLNKEHPGDGASKAKWFESALGFTKENIGDLAKQIIFDESKAVKTVATEFGQKFNQTISVKGANGKSIDVVFGFIKNEDNVVRMTTAIPTKK